MGLAVVSTSIQGQSMPASTTYPIYLIPLVSPFLRPVIEIYSMERRLER